MIIYFTGTGNSEYAAKAMADILGDEAFCCNSAIKNKASVTFSSEKPYLFVFPVYLSTSPAIFRDFIKSCKFTGNKDAYFVPTCASSDGSVPNASMDLCLETGFLNYKGCRKICMPQNYIAFFETFDETKIQNCIQNADESISEICAIVKSGKDLDESPAGRFEYIATKLVEKIYNSGFTVTKPFYTTDSCIGCGLCEKSCPTDSIKMTDGKPTWIKAHCIHCMSCINRCPKQAIEFGRLTVGKARYICPQYGHA